MNKVIGKTKITVDKGDITTFVVDAIVNAANSSLMGGGGVDGAIHRAGGPQILEECKKIVSRIGSLPTGEAVITTAGNMRATYVIHTVGPVFHGGARNEEQLLFNAYYNSLKIGRDNKVKTIAFPSISTGVYGYPISNASLTAVGAISSFLINESHDYTEVHLVAFSENDYKIIQNSLQ